MDLRDYQRQLCNNAYQELRGAHFATLGVLPTGCGKTVCFSAFIKRWLKDNPGTRALIMAHREELIFQAQQKYKAVNGEEPEIEMGERSATGHALLALSDVIVTSVQTQNAGRKCKVCSGGYITNEGDAGERSRCPRCIDGRIRRMQKFRPEDFSLLVIDEAHHATARSYMRVIDYYKQNPNLKVFGVTATPDRTDKKALGKVFDSVAFNYELNNAIDDGWLVNINQEFVTCQELDFSQIETPRGDFTEAQLEEIMLREKSLHQIATPTLEIAGDRATIVFASSVAHAELLAEIFNRHKKESAICIHGKTPADDRRKLLREYAKGKYQFLCGCGVFLEGFDEPRIQVVAMARPTKSRSLYAQAVGRGTRPISPPMQETAEERRQAILESEKPELLVLDFVGNAGKHKLVCTADLLGGDFTDEEIERATHNARERDEDERQTNMRNELEQARRELQEEEEVRKREAIRAKAEFQRQQVSPFLQHETTPERSMEGRAVRRPTPKQVSYLERSGVKDADQLSFVQASRLCGEITRRRNNNLATYKQAKVLEKYGYSTEVSFHQAKQIIDQIAANGWERPVTVKTN